MKSKKFKEEPKKSGLINVKYVKSKTSKKIFVILDGLFLIKVV